MSLPNQEFEEDIEWDASKATVTAWESSRRRNRTYGRRASATVPSSTFKSLSSTSASKPSEITGMTATTTSASSKFQTSNRSGAFGQRRFRRHASFSVTSSNDCNNNMEMNKSESSLRKSSSKNQSIRSMSMSCLNEYQDGSSSSTIAAAQQAVNEENLNPNIIDNLGGLGFQENSLSFSTNNGACFSSICKSSEIGFNIPCLTPSRSISSSSRKRGVCESPLFHCDDASSSGGGLSMISNMHQSTSSFGGRRSKTRIFSPESTQKIMAKDAARAAAVLSAKNEGMTSIRKKNESFYESESDKDGDMDDNENSFSLHNTSCEITNDIDLDDGPEIETFRISSDNNNETKKTESIAIPMQPRRMSSLGDITFEEAIFGQVENTTKNDQSKNHIFESMSSYEDLKFLLKQLRRWSGGKLLVSFGMNKNCTVVPPNAWPATRKSAFIEWTTVFLGFSYRCCGGGVNYLQIGSAKAKIVQEDLERALLQYKEANKNVDVKACVFNKKKNNDVSNQQQTPLPMSSIKISRIEYTPMSIERNLHVTQPQKDNSDEIIEDLASNLNDLNLEQHWYNNEHIHEQSDCGATPLARMVTLPDEITSTTHVRQPRYSHDNFVMASKDFVSHMHGISPLFASKSRRPSLALPRRQHAEGKSSSSIAIFSPQLPVITAALSFDQAETPGVNKLINRRWGSRPIVGKDWGQSECCDVHVIARLTSLLEEACSGNNSSVQETSMPMLSSKTIDVRPGMSGIKADSKSLGFELELDNSFSNKKIDDDYADEEVCDEFHVSPSSRVWSQQHNKTMPEDAGSKSDHIVESSNERKILPMKLQQRRAKSYAKRSRMSICISAMDSRMQPFRSSLLQKSFAYQTDLYPCPKNILGPSPVKRNREKILLTKIEQDVFQDVLSNSSKMLPILSFLNETELQCTASLVCSTWADAATEALASLMLISVGCSTERESNDIESSVSDDASSVIYNQPPCSVAISMQRQWDYIVNRFPWGTYLSEGTFKRVFRVWNSSVNAEEAVSVMDVNKIDDKNIVGNELAVSVMLSSLARRNVCPNFVKMRGVFTSIYGPPKSQWGCSENKAPLGRKYNVNTKNIIKDKGEEPPVEEQSHFQYIRMELCKFGDVEEFIKNQPDKSIHPLEARMLLFQMAFSLHVAGDRFGLKHYDVKLLNFFMQSANDVDVSVDEFPFTVLRYGFGAHVFNLKMPTSRAFIAKLADFGTANTRSESNGQPVMLNNFTTLENTPPDFLILGDAAVQGFGHDFFGLGLSMLHLFTGDAPYEEIMESVTCPVNLKKKLKRIWEGNYNKGANGYSVIQSVITLDVWEDEDGNVEGEIDETLYDTLYRYLVLFDIPQHKFQWKEGCKVWNAISSCLEDIIEKSPTKVRRSRRNNTTRENGANKNNAGLDLAQFQADRDLFNLRYGKDPRITRARENLESMEGGMDLLFSLVAFDPNKRASALDVINSTFMAPLREEVGQNHMHGNEKIYSYMSYFAVQENVIR